MDAMPSSNDAFCLHRFATPYSLREPIAANAFFQQNALVISNTIIFRDNGIRRHQSLVFVLFRQPVAGDYNEKTGLRRPETHQTCKSDDVL